MAVGGGSGAGADDGLVVGAVVSGDPCGTAEAVEVVLVLGVVVEDSGEFATAEAESAAWGVPVPPQAESTSVRPASTDAAPAIARILADR